uniref:CCHC-type domain-containing protein n=1 Tax=Fagus sylvatica TaxID=28930 RepID=A0A2N9GYR8_FAGSY
MDKTKLSQDCYHYSQSGTTMSCGPKTYVAFSKAIVYGVMSQVRIKVPDRSKDEDDTKFTNRLENWDCKNHQFITWFCHSTVPSIHQQFGRYDNAKDVWDLLSHHYTTAGLFHEYQLWGLLVYMKQAPRQPINKNGSKYCKNYHKQGHLLSECPTVQCQYCHKIGHIIYNCPTKPSQARSNQGILPRPVNHSVTVTTEESPSDPSLSSVSVCELGPLVFTMVKQFLSTFVKVSSAVSGTSQQNGRAERKHCHILDSVRAFLISASFPERFWGKAALTALYTINRLPSSILQNVSPFERLYDPYAILPIPFADSPISLLAPPQAMDLVIDQPPDLPLATPPATPIAPPPVVDPVLDQVSDYPLATPPADSSMDVKNAFLNGDLTEEVYMQAPPGYSDCPDKVCLLRRTLYGLKQAPRVWFAKFSSIVHQFGFSSSPHDTTLFIRRSDKGMILFLLYVDDMIIIRDDHSDISDFKQFLHQQFEMKDLGHLSYFLGIEVSFDSTGYYLSLAKYAFDLLSRVGLTDTKVVSTPLEMNARLTRLDGTPLSDATLYHHLVGNLIYLTMTRLDIAHAVHLGILLTAALLLAFVSFWGTLLFPSAIRNNILCLVLALSAIQIAHNDVFHERTKHIEIDCHLVRHHLSVDILHLLPVSSSDQTADIFKNTFLPGRFHDLVSKLKMTSIKPP